MAQTFPLVSIDPSTKTGIQLATDLENFSETMRSMMSGPARAAEFIEGLWLRTNLDGTAELVYSNAAQDVDLPIFTVAQNGTGIAINPSVTLQQVPPATTDATGLVRLATEAEALAGTSASAVPLVRETQAMIAQAIDNLVAGSTSALDTLNELATALGNDPGFAATTASALAKRVAIDAPQSFSASEQAQARANLGLGALALQDRVTPAELDDAAVTSAKIGAQQVDKAKLAADVFANLAQTFSAAPASNQVLSPQLLFAADEVAVVDVPGNAPTTLAGNGYKRRFYVQSTGGMYRWVPAPVDAFVLQGTAAQTLAELADVSLSGDLTGSILYHNGLTWTARAYEPSGADTRLWQNVLSTRQLGVSYQNDTDEPITLVFANGSDQPLLGGGDFQPTHLHVSSDGTTFHTVARSIGTQDYHNIEVPVGHFYRLSDSAPGTWLELRQP